ncbi:MAG: hypothetical protein Q9216_004692 [Gyalolechia sp. 2 TL-2023]
MFLRDLAWFAENDVYSKTWNFGQIVAITVWAPPVCEFIHLEIRGMQRGFNHRLLYPYRVSKNSNIGFNGEAKIDGMETGDYGDNDLEQGREPPRASSPLQADPSSPPNSGDKVTNIPMSQGFKHKEDDGLHSIRSEDPATIIPLRDERMRESEEERLLPAPKLTLALSALALSTRPREDDYLCYDSRYATREVDLDACSSIIARQIVKPPFNTRPVIFSRRPIGASEYAVPRTWRSHAGGERGCVVTIDVPELPSRRIEFEESSLVEVKNAVILLAAACVVKDPKLGGIILIGADKNLQVSIEGE